MGTSERIILAADGLELDEVLDIARAIGDRLYAVKVHDVFDAHGPKVVKALRTVGARRVWYDAKLHDIPNTVGWRARAIGKGAEPGTEVDILTVHASGEIEMMMKAVEHGPQEIYAVTALTSLDEEQVHLTYGQPSKAAVLYLARLAKLAGVHGIVCSPKEVGMLAKRPELEGLKFIVPGVRSAGVKADDQKRTDTPAAAVRAGAHHLVIGRQLTLASDPSEALDEIEDEIAVALAAVA